MEQVNTSQKTITLIVIILSCSILSFSVVELVNSQSSSPQSLNSSINLDLNIEEDDNRIILKPELKNDSNKIIKLDYELPNPAYPILTIIVNGEEVGIKESPVLQMVVKDNLILKPDEIYSKEYTVEKKDKNYNIKINTDKIKQVDLEKQLYYQTNTCLICD